MQQIHPENWITQLASRLQVRHFYPYQILVMFYLLQAMGLLPPDASPQQHSAEDSPAVGANPPPSSVLCLFPTGMGKTLCFMGPLSVCQGISVVVYPLNALLHDQQRRFNQVGIPSRVLQGGQSPEVRREIFHQLTSSEQIVILTNPETLLSPALDSWWSRLKIKNLIVDEVHLVDQWGADFRPLFRELGEFRRFWGISCIGAFSATVSEQSLGVLQESLFIGEQPRIVRAPLDRPNIHFSVLPCYSPLEILPLLFSPLAVLFGIEPLEQPALVFAPTRKLTETAALGLRSWQRLWAKQISASSDFGEEAPPEQFYQAEECQAYHAGLDPEQRSALEAWFFPKDSGILCATCAYGTGIDKPNIRTVVHLTPPTDPQAYVQESGRGGRSGEPARALLLLPREAPDWARDYSRTGNCRRSWLTQSLSDELEGCSGCDSCDDASEYHTPLEWRLIQPALAALGGRATMGEIKHQLSPWGEPPSLLSYTALSKLALSSRILDELPPATLHWWLECAAADGYVKKSNPRLDWLLRRPSPVYNRVYGRNRISRHRDEYRPADSGLSVPGLQITGSEG